MNRSEPDQLYKLRHSAAHLLARAVLELYPGSHNAIGPAIETGFYQDFDLGNHKITDEDFKTIEKKMQEIQKSWDTFEIKEVPIEQARKDFAHNPYKSELVEEFAHEGKTITETQQGDFLDLCKGGHLENPKELKHFKLLSVAGAYWRGDEKNKMLTRIYGTAFSTKDELFSYIKTQEEAKKRDHRKLGQELELFTTSDEIGPGLPMFYPNGATLRRVIEEFVDVTQRALGFTAIWVPHIAKAGLYETSGHLGKYDAMFPPMQLDDVDYYLKPMNCPHFMTLYKTQLHSYRDLPLRWTCTTTVYRNEQSGELAGLTRVRALTQDDCHVFMRADQIEQEFGVLIDLIEQVYAAFGLQDFWVSVSVRDKQQLDDYLGDPTVWDNAERTLEDVVAKRSWEYKVVEGEAAFYGPKLDFMARDAIGREWQLSTLQLDFNLPERFELEYVAADGSKQRPVVVHRAVLGSVERWMGIMIEHFAGAFPVWLAPVQVELIAVGAGHVERCTDIAAQLTKHAVRVVVNGDDETVGNKIRKATKKKIPYVIVIGDKEVESGALTVRKRGESETMEFTQEDFLQLVRDKTTTYSLEI